jgi:uncharacterized protein (TIGR02453 family)
MHDFPPFPGFRSDAFDFLRQLACHNERDWFKARKTIYDDEVRWPLQCLVVDAARQLAALDLPLTGDPKHSLFRIYRDTRFSKNKQPYKTHAGAVLSRSGSPKDDGVLYIHIEPGQTFLAGGFWQPDAALLRAWRARLAEAPIPFLEMTHTLDAAGLPLWHGDNTLKRMPRGYEALAETEAADYLRWKSFVVTRPVPDDVLQSPDFTETVVAMARDALPLLEYGWHLTARVPS